jgi:hypothetical protein
MRTTFAAFAALGLTLAFLATSTSFSLAQKSDRASIPDEEYANLLEDFISVLPNSFDVIGTNTDGSTYRGTAYVSFDSQSGDLSVDWQIAGQSFSGRGPLIGGEFIVDWGQSSPVIYTVQRNGDLFGTWADGEAFETLTFAP